MPETTTDIPADLPQSSIPKPTEEDHLIKELHIQYGNLQTNMSPLCIVLQNDLVYLWRNEVHLQLVIIRCRVHLLTVSQRRQSPIHKEADGVHRVIDLGKPYLLQTLSPHNYLLTDAASISYISRAKYFDNFLMEISITISEYPSHHVVHCPGRCLSVISVRNMHISSPV